MATERLVIELDAKNDKANIKINETTTSINKLDSAVGVVEKSLGNVSAQSVKAGGAMRGMSHRAGQLGFQLQDVAVQAQSGTSAFTILSQQGSQIASVFGPGGAVIGALVAIGSAIVGVLVTSLLKGNDSLVEFKEKLEKATSAQVKFLNATSESTKVDALKVSLDKLNLAMGEQIEKQTKAREAIAFYKENLGGTPEEIASVQNAIEQQNGVIEDAQKRIDAMNDSMSSLSDAALPEMTDGITTTANVTEAWIETLRLQSEIMGKTKSEIVAQTAATLTLTDEQQKVVDGLIAQLKAEEELAEARRTAREEAKAEAEQESEADKKQREMEKLQEFILTRAELLDQQLIDDLDRLTLAGEILGLTEEEQYAKRLELIQDFADKKAGLETKGVKKEKKEKDDSAKEDQIREIQKLDRQQNAIRAGQALNEALFGDNKAIAAGLIVADTATAIMRSLAINPYDYVNVGIIAATGVAQLANALSASKGGGSVSASSSSSPSSLPLQANFEPDTTSLDLSSSTAGGSSNQTITFAADAGDELMSVMVGLLQKAVNKGQA